MRTTTMTTKRIFSEQEAGEILQRAARLQVEKGETYASGITEDELAKMAAEAGISREALLQAIQGLPESETKRRFLKLVSEESRVIDGELDPGDLDLVVGGLRSMRHDGLKQIGRQVGGRVWFHGGMMHLAVTSRQGRTRVDVRTNAFFPLFFTLYPAFISSMLMITGTAARGNALPGVLGACVAWAAASIIAPIWLRATHRSGKALADRMADKVTEAISTNRDAIAQATPVISEAVANSETQTTQS
jgi:hypothetical protein